MSKAPVTVFASSLIATLVCCSVASAQSGRRTAAADDPDMKELASYTLSVDTLNRVDRAMKATIATMQKDPKYAERVKMGKELDALKKKTETTDADDKRIEQLEAQIEKFDEANNSSGDAKTLGDMERKIAGMPALANALKAEGLSPRDFAKFTLAMLQSAFAAGAKQMTEKMGKPFQLPPGVNAANVKFVEEHQAEIKKMQDSYAQMGGS
jgi:hypothetical protein